MKGAKKHVAGKACEGTIIERIPPAGECLEPIKAKAGLESGGLQSHRDKRKPVVPMRASNAVQREKTHASTLAGTARMGPT
ncbi:MAG: hypothetical protein CBB71_04665 [Rhodopirellula sp. TMED11]|nr:MAG: hypothetical protein CBB71_04665 [Rhodopirellula sp. TMED11]